MRREQLISFLALAFALALTGCSLGDLPPAETSDATSVVWATRPVEPTLPPLAAATVTPAPTDSPSPAPSATPPPTSPTWRPILTAAPTLTPTLTRTPFTLPTRAPTATPAPSATPAPVTVPARVCEACSMLRLRDAPGTAGEVRMHLAAEAPLELVGRTDDGAWVEVITADGTRGWVSAEYVEAESDLGELAVAGSAVDAPPGADSLAAVSGVTSTAREIFLDGRAKGNIPYAFTRVGDSISAAPQFLTLFGTPHFHLGEYEALRDAVGWFSGPNGRGANPFAASSLAAHNGWGTTSALDPANADPAICRPGETPLECEYRLVKPAVALIMFGTNDSGGLPLAEFRANLDAIVRISIRMGVIPVLSTIPPKQFNPATDGRVPEFNQAIIEIAQSYDVPLWNYWQAMAALPNNGLDPDGVHPSTPPDANTAIFDADHLRYGYTARNLGALQVLDALRREVLYDGDRAPAATSPALAALAGCEGTLPPRLRAGQPGRVTPGLPNKLRAAPSTSAAQIGSIPAEAAFDVLDGPTCADGYAWWQVRYGGTVGWTAEAGASEYFVEAG